MSHSNPPILFFIILKHVKNGPATFFSLFEDSPDKDEVITVFLALLELLKLNKVIAKQKKEYEDIMIERNPEAAA